LENRQRLAIAGKGAAGGTQIGHIAVALHVAANLAIRRGQLTLKLPIAGRFAGETIEILQHIFHHSITLLIEDDAAGLEAPFAPGMNCLIRSAASRDPGNSWALETSSLKRFVKSSVSFP
jgi:hypothetical protein